MMKCVNGVQLPLTEEERKALEDESKAVAAEKRKREARKADLQRLLSEGLDQLKFSAKDKKKLDVLIKVFVESVFNDYDLERP